jgi:hypothetical protein
MEILASARDDSDRDRLRRLLNGLEFRNDAELLCDDSDFIAIARHPPLRLA